MVASLAEPVDEHVRRRPAAPLRPFVAWYSGYRTAGAPPGRHIGLPSPYLTLILTLDDPVMVAAHPDPSRPPCAYDTLISGLHTAPALITHDGRQSGVQLALTPAGVRALFGLPAGELAATEVEAADVLGAPALRLRDRLRAAPGWTERFALLDAELPALIAGRPGAGPAPEVGWAWRRLLAGGGAVPVGELAAETGWSPRHLSGRFRAEIGLTPKQVARVVRFDRARRLLARRAAAGGPPELARLAAACGYYDQAHLAREFREFAGHAPVRWLAEEFRNVQVTGPPEAADSPV
ncbi:AraC family transcriptional regulator [Sphaerisporangium rufum]|uniref:AraC family transcriptional regulator n=1 Tax=Sphaerisporangium rufum TaxID=1381558 RepID=UPI0019526448|nr:helix-turn-helix domain-containing protein [Sphaerisporangium rufum]